MRRKRAACILLSLLIGGTLAPTVIALAISYSVTFDPGTGSYEIEIGYLDTVGNPGNAAVAIRAEGDPPNKRSVAVNVPVNCAMASITVTFQLKFSTGNYNDYLGASFRLYSGQNIVGAYDFGYAARTPHIWLNFSREISPSAPVDRVRVVGTYTEPNPEYIYMDNISVSCTEGEGGGAEYDSDPPAGSEIVLGNGLPGETIISDGDLTISNLGDALLLNGFEITGAAADDFEMITDSPLGVQPSGTANVVMSCTPSTWGERRATLTVSTNDVDEPTNVYYLVCNAELASPDPFAACAMLGTAARFVHGSGWQYYGEASQPQGQSRGVYLPPGSGVSLRMSVRPDRHYAIEVRYRAQDEQEGTQSFNVYFGGHPGYQIPIDDSTADLQTLILPYSAYPPDYGQTSYTLALGVPEGELDTGLIVEYVCVTAASGTGGTSGDEDREPLPSCFSCIYTPAGDLLRDFLGIIDWLFCNISMFLACTLYDLLGGLWATVVRGVISLGAFVGWIFESAVAWVGWIGQIIWLFITIVYNMLTNIPWMISNALHASGVMSLLNQLLGDASNAPRLLANQLSGGGSSIGTGANLIGGLGNLIGTLVMGIGYLIAIVPVFIASLVSGFNLAAYEPISGSISCVNPSGLLYFPCYGFYVLDNTVFSGPAAWLIPIIIAVLAFDTITWAMWRFREAFSK